MRKKILSFALALAMCLGLTIPAFAAGGMELPDEGRIQIYNGNVGNAVFVIEGDGALYRHEINDDVSDYSSTYITDNAKQILYRNERGERLFLLKNSGELFFSRGQSTIEEPAQYYETKIADHVIKFGWWGGEIYALKDDGTLWLYDWLVYETQGGQGAEELVLSGVKDIAVDEDGYYRGYLTDSAANFTSDTKGGPIDNGEKLYCYKSAAFVITADGSLWNLGGVNTTGECGNGGKYTDHNSIYIGDAPIAPVGSLLPATGVSCHNTKDKILSNVERLSYDSETGAIVALRTDGSTWAWGDGERFAYTVTSVDSSGHISSVGNLQPPADMTGFTPRKLSSPPSQKSFRKGETITAVAQSDGTLIYRNTDKGKTLTLPNWTGNGVPAQPQQPAAETIASPTNDKLEVNGNAADPTVYKIGGSNYFKIRDVAALLNGTEKQFAVGYDGEKNAVTATTGQGYEKQSGDLAGAANGGDQSAAASNDAIYVNGEKITAEVYKIDGSNYFKLRDLGKALNFYVGWSADRGVYIETDKPYSE